MMCKQHLFGLEFMVLSDVVLGIKQVLGVAERVLLCKVTLYYKFKDVTIPGAQQ
jgi:hypothetical protein